MCGRFVTIIPPEELAKIFKIIETASIQRRYNVAPTQTVSVVRNTDGNNALVPMKWGLIPSWSKDAKIAYHTINARCETVAEKPAFRHAIKVQRCIVPTSGFYEWAPAPADQQHKQPYYIQLADSSPMCFAGIWEHWQAPDGVPVESFSILTTTSNELIRPMHERMPVILDPIDFDFWLDRSIKDPHALESLYKPFPADKMTSYRVSTLVNSPKHDNPSCIERLSDLVQI